MRTAKAHRKFAIYSNFLDTIFEGEEEIPDGSTRKEVLKKIVNELEETAAELKKEVETMRGEIITETIKVAKNNFPPIGPSVADTTEKSNEEFEATLAADIKTLQKIQYKEDAEAFMNEQVWRKYNPVLKSLVNAKPNKPA